MKVLLLSTLLLLTVLVGWDVARSRLFKSGSPLKTGKRKGSVWWDNRVNECQTAGLFAPAIDVGVIFEPSCGLSQGPESAFEPSDVISST